MRNNPYWISIVKEVFEFFLLFVSGSSRRNSDKTILISQENKNEGKHINTIVKEFEESILTDSTIKKWENNLWILSGSSKLKTILGNLINYHILQKQKYYAILMGPDFRKLQPLNLLASQLDIYMFDAWPPDNFSHIEEHIGKLKISHIFFSSKQVAEIFQNNKIQNCYWIPEAVDYKKYHFYNYEKKDIDILQFGRRYEWLHEKILNSLNTSSIKYMYSDSKLLLNSDLEFKEGLAKSKISLCFPASLTHPERSRGISTMTTRYLQSMASKCLVVGIIPDEMKELFPYTPIVELDLGDPVSHLSSILADFSSYIPLIERNYQYIIEHHTWIARWNSIEKHIHNV
jgi:hypothetical protein